MSHSSTLGIEMVIADGIIGLLKLLAETGCEAARTTTFKTDDGQKHAVDVVAKDTTGAQVGAKIDAKTGQVTLIAHDCKGTKGKALANRIAQRWAYSKVTEELRRKGYELGREEKQQDGSIRLVASKWR